jgi:hypothetical protein
VLEEIWIVYDDFGNSAIGSEKLGGSWLPKSQSHEMQNREMREKIWTVDLEKI